MYNDVKKQIGSNLRELRLSRGLKQHELAEKAGVEDKTISRIEVGGNYPSISLLVKLSEILNCNLTDFVKTESQNTVKSSIKELSQNEIKTIKKFLSVLSKNINDNI